MSSVRHDSNVTQRTRKTTPHPTSSQNKSPEAVKNVDQSTLLEEVKIYIRELIEGQTKSIQQTIVELTNSIKNQNTRLDQLEARISALETRTEQPVEAILTPSIQTIESSISQLQANIAERDQALLANDVEVAGCPKVNGENYTHTVLTLARKIGVSKKIDGTSRPRTSCVHWGRPSAPAAPCRAASPPHPTRRPVTSRAH